MDTKMPRRFEEGLGYLIHHLMYAMRQTLARQCRESGCDITAEELAVLMIISEQEVEPGLTQTQIAETLAKDKAVITRLLNSLSREGLVLRTPDEQDRRIVRARLTKQGFEAVNRLRPVLGALLGQLYEGISDEEFLATKAVLQRLLSNLKSIK
ncbi:transcriptional activatory protein BadR [Mariprofundus micogutta]|uniref:Transcriptional activatory protein BadR n=1 Tax=Mariprofundus micogutta TaxID=1921010 RepID=A0A1L8CPF5_9PROT|nr:MarR family transcriptional regulator [Mariprofundus micogutta]GAV20805.1 transcriptional activatory protein BadR [Mariprofundus micogutta]